MPVGSTVNTVGHYCGRFGPGLLGEPLNSFSNLAFVAGAALAWLAWRRNSIKDPWQLPLFALAAAIGAGSFIFHSAPTPTTLLVALVPIQLFGLVYVAYLCVRYLRVPKLATLVLVTSFFVARQWWIAAAPQGGFGGGITHVPSLLALIAVGACLLLRREPVGRYVLAGCAAYIAALLARSWDLYLCPDFTFGLHWLWHLLTGLTCTMLVYGIARMPPGSARHS